MIGFVRGVVRTVTILPRALEAILMLPKLVEQLDAVKSNTDALNDILGELRAVHLDTVTLPQLHAEMAAMRSIVEQVEAHTLAVEQLAEIVVPLQGAAARVGRFADRLPQRRVSRGD